MLRVLIHGVTILALASLVRAGTWDPLTPSNWDEAQKSGGVTLLEFSSADCKTCAAQKKELRGILTSDPHLAVTGLQINLGADGELERRFSVKQPGTLLLLRGGHELARSVGLCSQDELRTFIDQAFLLKRWASPGVRPPNRLPLAP